METRERDLTGGSLISAIPDQVSCDLGGEAAILNLRNGTYYGLDPVGALIWNTIQTPKSIDQIVEAVMAEFEVDRERCEDDVRRLIGNLREQGLV